MAGMIVNDFLAPNHEHWRALDDNVLEGILARLPVVDYFRCQFVCRRWRAIIHSPTFLKVCHEYYNHRPWFLMRNSKFPSEVVYDAEVDGWRHIPLPIPRYLTGTPTTPVAASNSLMCFISRIGTLFVCNPLTGSTRPLITLTRNDHIKAVAIHAWGPSYYICIVSWRSPRLSLLVFSSVDNSWTTIPLTLVTLVHNHAQGDDPIEEDEFPGAPIEEDEFPGEVLAPVNGSSDPGWLPQVAVTRAGNGGHLIVYYLEPNGRLVGCNANLGTALIFPELVPLGMASMDLVECRGRILIVSLVDEMGAEMLKVWEFDRREKLWKNVSVMPPEMSQEYNGTDADICCAGCGDYIMVCVSSENYNINKVVMYNIVEDSWSELPMCFVEGCAHAKRFVTAYAFMPSIDAQV